MNKKIKVLHLITSLEQGGAQKNLFNICRSCDTDTFVISLTNNSYYSKALDKINIKNISLNINKKNIFSIFNIFKIPKIILNYNPSIIQTWLYHADLIGSIIKIIHRKYKIIWTVRHTDTSFLGNKSTTFFIIRLLIPLSYFVPNKIIYCASSSIRAHEKIFYCKNKTLLISNGLDMNNKDYIDFNFKKKSLNGNDLNDSINFISVARFHPIKNHFLLLDSFLKATKKITKKVHLFMIGHNITFDNEDLKSFILNNNLSDKITLLGSQDNIYPFLKESHFLILTSNSEAFPNVILEASLCCTPSISTNVGDAKNIIGENGYIVPIKNRPELTNVIIEVTKLSKSQYERLASQTRERSLKMFSYTKMINSYNHAYRSIL